MSFTLSPLVGWRFARVAGPILHRYPLPRRNDDLLAHRLHGQRAEGVGMRREAARLDDLRADILAGEALGRRALERHKMIEAARSMA